MSNSKLPINLLDFKSGCEQAYFLIYQRFYKPIWKSVREKIHNPEVAEEITQEIFLKVHRFRESYKTNHAFTTWLWTIAKNTIYDYLRKMKSTTDDTQAETFEFSSELAGGFSIDDFQTIENIPSPKHCPESMLISKDDRLGILKVVRKLTRSQKKVLWNQIVHQKSYVEISNLLQLSLASVKNLAYRGRITLLEHLDAS